MTVSCRSYWPTLFLSYDASAISSSDSCIPCALFPSDLLWLAWLRHMRYVQKWSALGVEASAPGCGTCSVRPLPARTIIIGMGYRTGPIAPSRPTGSLPSLVEPLQMSIFTTCVPFLSAAVLAVSAKLPSRSLSDFGVCQIYQMVFAWLWYLKPICTTHHTSQAHRSLPPVSPASNV